MALTSDCHVQPCLEGLVFALSLAGGSCSRKDIVKAIAAAGGRVSNIVNDKVDFLLATPQALTRNTQARFEPPFVLFALVTTWPSVGSVRGGPRLNFAEAARD
eukprot:2278815-Pleurochrysis_carterae.AAC.2